MTQMFVHDEDKSKRKKTGGRVIGSVNKTKADYPAPKEKRPYKKRGPATSSSGNSFLFFTVGKDEFVEQLASNDALKRAEQIFAHPKYADLQSIYLMKPLKLFNRPVMQITEL